MKRWKKLAYRYFISRGPATIHDFAYWSGLTIKDANAGAASLSSLLFGRSWMAKNIYSNLLFLK